MAVTLYNIEFFDEFTGVGGGGIDFLAGAIGDKITCHLTFDVSWFAKDIPAVFDAATKTITRQDIVTFTVPTTPPTTGSYTSFLQDGFKVGDTIEVVDSVSNDGTYTITAVTTKVITVAEALLDETDTDVSIYGTTPITAVDFFYNLIENDNEESYKSLFDTNSTNWFNCSTLIFGMGSTLMGPVGKSRGWVNGTAYIDDVAYPLSPDYIQRYEIIHTFFITPLFISAWKANIDNGSNPKNFYQDKQSLKYIARIDAKFNALSMTPDHTGDIYYDMKEGAVGFYNEFLVGGDANYTLKSITLTDTLTSASVTELQYSRSTDVDIRITSVHNKFTAGCKVVLNQIYEALDMNHYTDTGTDVMINNYRFDRKLLTEGVAAADGEQVGTDNQCIMSAEANVINAGELQILYTCTLAADYNTMLASKDIYNRNYIVFVTPQDLAVTDTDMLDRNAVICHTDNYSVNKDDATLWALFCKKEFGTLYNWYAATNIKEITSSVTWTVPLDTDYDTLTNYLGGVPTTGGKLKESGLIHWITPNTGAVNSVNFKGIGIGRRESNGIYENIQKRSWFWTQSTIGGVSATIYALAFDNEMFLPAQGENRHAGNPIRIVRAATAPELALTDGTYCTQYNGNDGKKYKTVKIGTQVWLAENLCETKYRDLSAIPEITGNASWTADVTGARCFYDNIPSYNCTCNNIIFFEYPKQNYKFYTDYKGFSNDLVLANCYFEVESLSNVTLQTLSVKIEATKAGQDNIVLEQYNFNLAAFPLDFNLIQQIDIEEPTNLVVPTGSDFEYYSLQRTTEYDNGNYIAYELIYPFKVRYETWVELISRNFANGTQDWSYYQEQGWAIKFNIYATVYDNVNLWTNNFLHTSDLSFTDFDVAQTPALTCLIDTYDQTGVTALNGIVLPDENTMVIATFTGTFGALPAGYTDYYGVITIDSQEIGGIYYGKYASTEEAAIDGDIWFTAATLTVVNATTITVSAVIDYTKLKNLSSGKYPLNYLSFYARLGYKK
jgi:uncharacterized protein (TIGR02145 family)